MEGDRVPESDFWKSHVKVNTTGLLQKVQTFLETWKVHVRGKSQTSASFGPLGWKSCPQREEAGEALLLGGLLPTTQIPLEPPGTVPLSLLRCCRPGEGTAVGTHTGVMLLGLKGWGEKFQNTWKKYISRADIFGNLMLKQFLFKLLCKNANYGSRH